MRRSMKTITVATTLIAGAASATMLYAHESQDSRGSMMGPGMMGQGGMMGMMGQMSEMMEGCNRMMQSMNDRRGSEKPNEQWREESPKGNAEPEAAPPTSPER